MGNGIKDLCGSELTLHQSHHNLFREKIKIYVTSSKKLSEYGGNIE